MTMVVADEALKEVKYGKMSGNGKLRKVGGNRGSSGEMSRGLEEESWRVRESWVMTRWKTG